MEAVAVSLRGRLKARWQKVFPRLVQVHDRYGRYFWTVHSFWALLTGAAVLVLAHNRYGYLPWVGVFLAVTWASTLFFSRFALRFKSRAFRFAQGFVSYLTRIMYQETLFFLLPFYFYSTTFPSWNCAYVVVLAGLAVFSCFDVIFDRLLRRHRIFALVFFAVVSFSALLFFLPLLLRVRIHEGAYLAAVVALLAAVPLAYPWREVFQPRTLLRIAAAVVLAIIAVRVARPVVPPVPLRLLKVRFAGAFDPRTRRAPHEYESRMPLSVLASGRLYAIATVFAPSLVPTSIALRFMRDGRELRSSRTVELVAHPRGFRVWDNLRAPAGGFVSGAYRLEVWTGEGQLVGRATIHVFADQPVAVPQPTAQPPGP
jgi:hypothetical protein